MKKNKESFGQAFTKACGSQGGALPHLNNVHFIRIARRGASLFAVAQKVTKNAIIFPHFHPMQPEVAKF